MAANLDKDRHPVIHAVLQHDFIAVEGMPGVGLPAPEQPSSGDDAPQGPMPVAFELAVMEDHKQG